MLFVFADNDIESYDSDSDIDNKEEVRYFIIFIIYSLFSTKKSK